MNPLFDLLDEEATLAWQESLKPKSSQEPSFHSLYFDCLDPDENQGLILCVPSFD